MLLKEGFYNGIINCRIGRAPDALLKKLAQQENGTTIDPDALSQNRSLLDSSRL